MPTAACRRPFATGRLLHSYPFTLERCQQFGSIVRCSSRFGVATAESYKPGRWLTYPAGLPVPPKDVYANFGYLVLRLYGFAPVSRIEFFGSPPAVKDRRWVPLPAGSWPVT